MNWSQSTMTSRVTAAAARSRLRVLPEGGMHDCCAERRLERVRGAVVDDLVAADALQDEGEPRAEDPRHDEIRHRDDQDPDGQRDARERERVRLPAELDIHQQLLAEQEAQRQRDEHGQSCQPGRQRTRARRRNGNADGRSRQGG